MNAYANYVVGHLLAQSWQIALLAGIVGLISWALRNRSAHLRYLLWLIVLAKCLVPPFLTVPLAILPERSASPSIAGAILPEEHSAPAVPVLIRGTPQSPDPAVAMLSTRELAALVWAAGVILFLLWVGGRAIRYTSWLRVRRRPLPPALLESVQELSAGCGFRTWPRIWLLDEISQPFVWGLLRGSVYLPADFIGLSGSDRQRSILAHELSHIIRFDAGVNLLQVIAQALYWFHPFVWWANRKIRQEREKCCDEMAVAHLRTPPEQYTGAIVDALVAERRSTHPIPSLAIVGSVKDIEERIKTMLKPGKTFRTRPSLVAATVALLIALVTIPTALVLTARGQAQPTAQSADKPTKSLQEPPADSEKPEQPRFAARTFNSKIAFEVFVWTTPEQGFRRIGSTPSAAPLEIPACLMWRVQPSTPVKDWDLLAREISESKVPGLRLDGTTDSHVKYLAGLTSIEWLWLQDTEITDAGLEPLKALTGLRTLTFTGDQVTDLGLAHLQRLTELRTLYLTGCRITDLGLASFQALKALENLSLCGVQITDAGLASLQHLPGLKYLGVASNNRITDAGLVHVESLARLEGLDVHDTAVTDAGLVHLKGLTRLQTLDLRGTKIDGTGMAHLKDLARLESVCLASTQMTDAGLANIKGLTGLRVLRLENTEITDLGLEHLKGLTGLQLMLLGGTQVTNAGVQQLKQSLPKLRIMR